MILISCTRFYKFTTFLLVSKYTLKYYLGYNEGTHIYFRYFVGIDVKVTRKNIYLVFYPESPN